MESEVRNKIFDFIYEMALRDAIMRKAYPWPPQETEPKREKLRDGMFRNKNAKMLIRNYIDNLLDDKQTDFYKTVDEIKKAFIDKGATDFTFGNAQKVLNMTVKYIYIAAYQKDCYSDLHGKFRECHCPMDSIMIEKVINGIKNQTHEEEVRKHLKGHERDWRGFLRNPWSRINEDIKQYMLFQELVKYLSDKEDLIPIEYDFKVWNEDRE